MNREDRATVDGLRKQRDAANKNVEDWQRSAQLVLDKLNESHREVEKLRKRLATAQLFEWTDESGKLWSITQYGTGKHFGTNNWNLTREGAIIASCVTRDQAFTIAEDLTKGT